MLQSTLERKAREAAERMYRKAMLNRGVALAEIEADIKQMRLEAKRRRAFEKKAVEAEDGWLVAITKNDEPLPNMAAVKKAARELGIMVDEADDFPYTFLATIPKTWADKLRSSGHIEVKVGAYKLEAEMP